MAEMTLNEKRRQWILSSVFTLILTVGTLYFHSVEAKFARELEQAETFKQELLRENAKQNQQIAVLESKLESMTKMLERMENKIDNLPRR